jgi:hypothetical protein
VKVINPPTLAVHELWRASNIVFIELCILTKEDVMNTSMSANKLARRENIDEAIPNSYNLYIYFGAINMLGIGVICVSLLIVSNTVMWEFTTIPIVFLLANIVEYFFHKGPLHHRCKAVDRVFEGHTIGHHGYFPHNNMGVKNVRETYWVFFPWFAIILLLIFAIPICGLLWWATQSSNVATFFLVTSTSYFLLYEWLHLTYHLPQDTYVFRIPVLGRSLLYLRTHHEVHHNQKLMGKYNFNITFPILDWVFGTCHRPNV